MKAMPPSVFKRFRARQLISLLWFSVTFLLTLLAGVMLFNSAIVSSLSSVIINFGLDPQRSLFIAALLLTTGAALLGAMLGRRKLAAIVGTGCVFWFSYLSGFINLESRPPYDTGGLLEPLNNNILAQTSTTMFALALVGGFIGAGVGVALAQTIFDPILSIIRTVWHRIALPRRTTGPIPASERTSKVVATIAMTGQLLGAAVMVVLLLVASRSGNLFIFSPDIGIHAQPQLHGVKGAPAHGTTLEDFLVSHALKGQLRPFMVYLPPSYNIPQDRQKRYPTLYLLHGSPGKDIDWLTGGKAADSADALIDAGKIPELIIISPDGNGRQGSTSEWGDSLDHKQNIEDYVATDLVQYVDKHYRTIADSAHRAIGGLSMGGFGAANIAIHHPTVFGTFISLGGYYKAEGTIWGKNKLYMELNSPEYTIVHTPTAWKMGIFLGAAVQDQPYYTYTLQFMRQLDKLHIRYHFDLQKGYHSWPIWQKQMYLAMLWLKWGASPVTRTGTSIVAHVGQTKHVKH